MTSSGFARGSVSRRRFMKSAAVVAGSALAAPALVRNAFAQSGELNFMGWAGYAFKIESLDKNQIEAARDLGASRLRIHARIVIPHAKPGMAVGRIMVFVLAASSYAVPAILGSTNSFWFTRRCSRVASTTHWPSTSPPRCAPA